MKKPIFDKEPYKSPFPRDEYEEKETSTSAPRTQRVEYKGERPPREVKVERKTIHRMLKEDELKPLRKVGPKVIGGLFDRVEFLKQRITETRVALETRKRLHEDLIKEIEADIEDKRQVLVKLSDVDDIRDFKLDISTLRMERRRENVLFWRDVLQLTTELRELMEEYNTESKIANLFRELKPGE